MEQFYFQIRFSARIRSKGSIAVGRLKTFALFAKNWLPRPFSARQIATFRFRPGFGRPIAQYAPRRSCFKAIMPVFSALRSLLAVRADRKGGVYFHVIETRD